MAFSTQITLTAMNTGTSTRVAGCVFTVFFSIRRIYTRNSAEQAPPPFTHIRITSLDMLGYDTRVHVFHCPLETASQLA
jgi:hypothetical protein